MTIEFEEDPKISAMKVEGSVKVAVTNLQVIPLQGGKFTIKSTYDIIIDTPVGTFHQSKITTVPVVDEAKAAVETVIRSFEEHIMLTLAREADPLYKAEEVPKSWQD